MKKTKTTTEKKNARFDAHLERERARLASATEALKAEKAQVADALGAEQEPLPEALLTALKGRKKKAMKFASPEVLAAYNAEEGIGLAADLEAGKILAKDSLGEVIPEPVAKGRKKAASFSRFNQPLPCRMCGKKTTWSEANGNGGLDLCQKCFDLASIENEHLDGHHQDAASLDCPRCKQEAQARLDAGKVKAADTSLSEFFNVPGPGAEQEGMGMAAAAAIIAAEIQVLVEEEKATGLLTKDEAATIRAASILEQDMASNPNPDAGVIADANGVVIAPEAPVVKVKKAKKAAKVVAPAPAPAQDGPVKLRLYAKGGEFYFGKAAAALLESLPYLRVEVTGQLVTLTPTKSAKDALEVKYSHGNPVVRAAKVLGDSWNKATQDLAITLVGKALQVEVQ